MEVKSKSYFFGMWAGVALIAFVIVWNLPWRFQVNDDLIMMWLVSGAYTGTPESYAVFIHPILSWIFSKVYSLAPDISWYPATWFIIMYFSFLVFLRCIWDKKNGNNLHSNFYTLFLFALLIHFLFFLQFSIVAAFAVASGLTARVLKFKKLPSEDEKSFSVFTMYKSDFLIVLGALIRIEVLFLIIAGILVLGIVNLKNFSIVKALILPSILLLFCFSVNQFWIHSNGLGDFEKANRLRSAVFDDPILQLRKDEYKETSPELLFFANGLMDFGREKELIEEMNVWDEILDKDRLESLDPAFFLKALTYWIWHERYFNFLFLLFLVFTFLNRFKQSLIHALILLGIMIFLSPFYLLKIQVYAVIMLVYFSVFFLSTKNEELKNIVSIPFLPVFAGIIILHFSSFLNSHKNLYPIEEAQHITQMNDASLGNQNLYLVGLDQVIYSFQKNKPVEIKFLGWPSLLINSQESVFFYKVNRKVYEDNKGYFKAFFIQNEYPTYLELVFKK